MTNQSSTLHFLFWWEYTYSQLNSNVIRIFVFNLVYFVVVIFLCTQLNCSIYLFKVQLKYEVQNLKFKINLTQNKFPSYQKISIVFHIHFILAYKLKRTTKTSRKRWGIRQTLNMLLIHQYLTVFLSINKYFSNWNSEWKLRFKKKKKPTLWQFFLIVIKSFAKSMWRINKFSISLSLTWKNKNRFWPITNTLIKTVNSLFQFQTRYLIIEALYYYYHYSIWIFSIHM